MIDNIDWMIVTNNIRAKYKPLSQVASEVGTGWQTLNQMARGEVKQPRYDVAIRLLDVHFDYCRDRHTAEILCRR
jgi:hypothetical protein